MISIRRALGRLHRHQGRREWWSTFSPSHRIQGFRAIEALGEAQLPPGAALPAPVAPGTERLTWVREGTLRIEAGGGRREMVRAGELQHLGPGGARSRIANASRTGWAHLVQLTLRSARPDLPPRQEHRRFGTAERRAGLCLVASPDGRAGSLMVHLDALVFSALLDPGHHLVHPLPEGRCAWLHVVHGGVALAGLRLEAGDGAGFTDEHAVSLVARGHCELLLLDLCDHPRRRAGETRSL